MDWTATLHGVIDTVIYSALGIVLMGLGFLLINFFSPFSVKKEIEDDQNISLGIIIGSVFIGIAIIVGSVISSPGTPSNTGDPKVEKKIEQNIEQNK